MRRLLYLSSARQDFRDILRYVTETGGNRRVGRAFVDKLQAQCRDLAGLPGILGRARPELLPDIRSFPYKGYIIFFRYREDVFEVVNGLEGHRDQNDFFAPDEPHP